MWQTIVNWIIQDITFLISLLVSLAALIISILGFRRSGIYQKYDYLPRLDIRNEIIRIGRKAGDKQIVFANVANSKNRLEGEALTDFGFSYSSDLQNQGQKPILINYMGLKYGKVTLHFVDGRFHLAPSESRHITFNINSTALEKQFQEIGKGDCLFTLVIVCDDVNGDKHIYTRDLGGYTNFGPHFFGGRNDALLES
jgi:hypothetical protein